MAQATPSHKVREFMITEVYTVSPQLKIREVAELLFRHGISGAPIVNTNGDLLSVIGEGDTLRLAAKHGLEATVAHILPELPPLAKLITLKPDEEFSVAYKLFLQHRVHRLPVITDSAKLKGLVTRSTLLTLFVEAHYGMKLQRPPK